jgi:hypothetical protein
VDPVLGVAVTAVLVVVTLLTIRSVERASAELGRCEPCRINEGVAQQVPSMDGGGRWSWASPMCCERDGTRRRSAGTRTRRANRRRR